jgi:hypothetical protein
VLTVRAYVHDKRVEVSILTDVNEDLADLIELLSVEIDGRPFKATVTFDTELWHRASIRRSILRFVAVGRLTAYLRPLYHKDVFHGS